MRLIRCISRNAILCDSKLAEVLNMLTTDWNIERAKIVWKREAREEGMKEGVDISAAIIRELIEKVSIEEIAEHYQVSVDKIKQLQSALTLYSV